MTGRLQATAAIAAFTATGDLPRLRTALTDGLDAGLTISQIKEKEYCQSLEDYQGNLLLVGINYDVKTKEHSCVIEKFVK